MTEGWEKNLVRVHLLRLLSTLGLTWDCGDVMMMSRMAIETKAIIFDLGNVIAFFDLQRFYDTAQITHEQFFSVDTKDKLELGMITGHEFAAELKDKFELPASEERLIEAWSDIFTVNTKVTEVIGRLPDDLRVVLGSATSAPHINFLKSKVSGLFDRFDELVVSYEVGVSKPAPEFFEACVAATGVEASYCFYVDDLAENIEAAEKIGVRGIVYEPDVDLETVLAGQGVKLAAA